jgi:hypothetical protein
MFHFSPWLTAPQPVQESVFSDLPGMCPASGVSWGLVLVQFIIGWDKEPDLIPTEEALIPHSTPTRHLWSPSPTVLTFPWASGGICLPCFLLLQCPLPGLSQAT